MAITYVGAASAASTSVSLPAFQAGDVAFVLVQNSSSTTAPTTPSGWVVQIGSAGTSSYQLLGLRVLQAGDTTTGTWTNATGIGVVIYRGVHTGSPIDGNSWGTGARWSFVENSGSWQITTPSATREGNTVAVDMAVAATGAISTATSTGWTTRTSGVSWTGFLAADGTTSAASFSNATAATELIRASFVLREASDGSGYPIVSDIDTTSGTVTANSISWTLTYPTNIAAGDLLLAFVAKDGGTTGATTANGWNTAHDYTAANALTVLARIATGSETGTFTATLAAAEQGSWAIYRIPAGTWYGSGIWADSSFLYSSAEGAGLGGLSAANNPSASANPNPPSLDPANWGAENTLWLAVASSDTSRTYSVYPSGFTNTGYLASGGSTGATLAYSRKEDAVASIDPSTFTHSASDDWVAATIAIRPAASGPFNFPVTAADAISSLTDAAARAAASRARSVAQTLGSISDAIVGMKVGIRLAADAVAAVSDSLLRSAASWARSSSASVSSISDALARAAASRSRSSSDSVGSVTDAVARVMTLARSLADAVSSVSDALLRGAASRVRSAAESIPSITDVVAAGKWAIRASADAVASAIDSLARVVSTSRSTSDAVASVTDAVARLLASARTSADSLAAGIADAMSRLLVMGRTGADEITVSESATRSASERARSTGDALTAGISEIAAGAVAAIRSSADSLASVLESVFAEKFAAAQNLVRDAADSISAMTDDAARILSSIRSSADDLPTLAEAIASIKDFIRSVADSSEVSEAISMLVAQGRTAADGVSSMTESVARGAASKARSAADAVSSVTESAVRAAISFVRHVR